MAEPFAWPVRVYWEDTDAGGVVFYANYLKFFERARTECFRQHGLGQEALRQEHGVQLVVAEVSCKYLQSARLDDQLSVSVALLECRGASLVLAQRIERDGALLVAATTRIAALRASSFRPCPLPEFLSSTLKPLLETP